jgi:hypothetical protein
MSQKSGSSQNKNQNEFADLNAVLYYSPALLGPVRAWNGCMPEKTPSFLRSFLSWATHGLAAASRAAAWPKRDWEIIADNLSTAGWSWGCVLALDVEGRTI